MTSFSESKNMKKVSLMTLLFFIVTLFVANAEVLHVGKENKYPIGNKDISPQIYLQFLKKYATGERYSYLHFSKYVEPSFMDTKWYRNNISCIKQTIAWFPEENCYCYDYSLILEHKGVSPWHKNIHFIIDAISNQEVQQEFNKWYADWLVENSGSDASLSNVSTISTSSF